MSKFWRYLKCLSKFWCNLSLLSNFWWKLSTFIKILTLSGYKEKKEKWNFILFWHGKLQAPGKVEGEPLLINVFEGKFCLFVLINFVWMNSCVWFLLLGWFSHMNFFDNGRLPSILMQITSIIDGLTHPLINIQMLSWIIKNFPLKFLVQMKPRVHKKWFSKLYNCLASEHFFQFFRKISLQQSTLPYILLRKLKSIVSILCRSHTCNHQNHVELAYFGEYICVIMSLVFWNFIW